MMTTTEQVGKWSVAVGKSYLAPFGLGNLHSTVTAVGTNGDVHIAASE